MMVRGESRNEHRGAKTSMFKELNLTETQSENKKERVSLRNNFNNPRQALKVKNPRKKQTILSI